MLSKIWFKWYKNWSCSIYPPDRDHKCARRMRHFVTVASKVATHVPWLNDPSQLCLGKVTYCHNCGHYRPKCTAGSFPLATMPLRLWHPVNIADTIADKIPRLELTFSSPFCPSESEWLFTSIELPLPWLIT